MLIKIYKLLLYVNYVLGMSVICFYLIAAALISYRVLFESNHIGHNLKLYLPYIFLLCIVGFINLIFTDSTSRKIGVFVLTLSLIAFSSVFLLDKFNILVEYNEWIQRGMPAKPWE